MSMKLYYSHNRARLKTVTAENCSYFENVLNKFFRYVRPLFEGTATPGNVLISLIIFSVVCHKVLTYALFYPIFRMVFGTLYPAYASYKAVRSRNVREYVKWMMYWIVFAIFNCIETFTDIFLSWFPFYYELKILLVIWLLAPATKGSSILYRKFVHPTLSNKEQEIDEYISKAKEQSYRQVLDLGTRGMSAIMQTAIKSGGGLVNQIKKSYSLSDLTDCNMDEQDGGDTMDIEPRLSRHSRSRRVGGSSSSTATPSTISNKMKASMYYSQLHIHADSLDSIPSEDLSLGYSRVDANLALGRGEPLQRTASLTRAKPTRVTRSTGVAVMRKGSTAAAEDSSENHIETESSSSASDEDFQDTVDTNAGENGPSASNVLVLVNDTIVTQSPEDSVLFPSFNTTPLNHNIIGTADSAITADIKCSSSDEPFTEFLNMSEETGSNMENLNEHQMKHKILELRIVDQDIMNITNTAENMSNVDTICNILEQVTSVLEDIEKIEELKINTDMQDEIRAGKYNKRHAPAIPERGSAITAKLVLKPGILKPLSNPEDSSVSQIFCHSPKFRRKSRGDSKSTSGSCSSLSRSRSGSKSPCRPKIDGSSGSLMKLAVLQKKLFGKDGIDKHDHCKRKSWHEGFLHGKMSDLFHPSGASEERDKLHDNDLD